MSTKIMNVFFFLLSLLSCAAAHKLCEVCNCKFTKTNDEQTSTVNCTAKGFTSSNITLLETLPDVVEDLIIQNNDLQSLPANLFGSEKNFTNLKVIDMTSNKIENVKGKAFHHVPNVERLILNHNSISLDNYTHPRMFSNLENLRELHLTDAFLDYESPKFANELHDVFNNSNMINLEKLHLEQNEIKNFSDPNVFCNLKNLLDLHLGTNILTGLHFSIDCLARLRYLDLEGNDIRAFTKEELAQFDALPARNQSLMIDIHNNPFVCDCESNLHSWLQTTQVFVRGNSSIRCHYAGSEGGYILLKDFYALACVPRFEDSDYTTHRMANFIILLILSGLILLMFYISARYSVDYFKQTSTSNGKVHYVVIKNFDEGRDVRV